MASFYFGRIKYTDYLQANSLVRDITGAIRQSGADLRTAISKDASARVASEEAIKRDLGVMSQGLDDIRWAVEDLNATFSYNMGLVIAQQQVQNRILLGLSEQLAAIHKEQKEQLQGRARELYRMGCDRMRRGLLQEALEALHGSEQKNSTDYLMQLELGRLYLYGWNEDYNVVNLEKARRHLLLAAKYGRAEIAFLPDSAASAGEAFLHAAIACHLLASEARLAGDELAVRRLLDESVRLALEAGELRPKLGEAHYQAAVGLVLLGEHERAISGLEQAIRVDRRYWSKADTDDNLAPARNTVAGMQLRLMQEARDKAREAVLSYDAMFDNANARHKEIELQRVDVSNFVAQNRLSDSGTSDLANDAANAATLVLQLTTLRARMAALLESGTYLDYLDTLPVVREATDSLNVCAELDKTIAQKLTQVRQKADDELAKRNADIVSAQSDLRAADGRLTKELRTLNVAMALVVLTVVAPLSMFLITLIATEIRASSGTLALFTYLAFLGASAAFAVSNDMWNWGTGEADRDHGGRDAWWLAMLLPFVAFFAALVWLFRYPKNRSTVRARYEIAHNQAQARLDRLTGKKE
jgi:TRAP-type C4-dicarboxylate transport system permease small subunit